MAHNLWTLVKKDPYNHYFWTELVRVAEESKSFEGIVRVYTGILEKFPLLHVYWNKWALLVHQNGTSNSVKDSLEIFERSVQPGVLENSVEMWQYYCEFATKYCALELNEDQVREILERAISHVGDDYQSDTIWSIYISWENERQRYDNVSQLYMRVLSKPVRNLDTFFSNFTEHAKNHSIEKAATSAEKSVIDDQLNQEADNDVTLKADDLERRMQTLIYEKRQQTYYQTAEFLQNRQFFEIKIRRTYFHFTRPNPIQIANWYEYIDFETKMGNIDRVQHLYERCLIPCQMCPDVWIMYANFLFSNGKAEDAEALLEERGLKGLIGRDPEFLRLYGMYEESHNQTEKARYIFEECLHAGFLSNDGPFWSNGSAHIALASYYLRQGTLHPDVQQEWSSKAIQILSDYLKIFGDVLPDQSKATRRTNSSNSKNENLDAQREYTIVAAALSHLIAFENPASDGSYISELRKKCLKVPLALALCVRTLIEAQQIDLAKQIYEDFLASPNAQMSLQDRCEMYPIYIEFLRRYSNITEIRKAERQYLNVQKERRLEIIEERREACKDTSNLSEIMDRWILYLQESDNMKRGFQETE